MGNVAVLDVETTGLNPYRYDRIIEIAVLIIRPDGAVMREFCSLVNPERDIGPTRAHGIRTRDVIAAPRFGEIAGRLLEVLSGCVALAGHNVRFDHSFLREEFARLGTHFPDVPTLCTMHLAGGGSLASVCLEYGIEPDGGAHTALGDARATARLLTTLLDDAPQLASEVARWPRIVWPMIPTNPVKIVTRDDVRQREIKPPTYLQRLLERAQPDLPPDDEVSASAAYTALLDRSLEDRVLDEEEGEALIELASRWAIPPNQIRSIHRNYLFRLAVAAQADGVVTDAERQDLLQVASLIGIDREQFDEILEAAGDRGAEIEYGCRVPGALRREELIGKRVCFTGQCECSLNGREITRDMAATLATSRGVVVSESVTKKLHVLVVADPLTQSGKARKARKYGIRIVQERVFWNALELEVE